MSVNVLWTGDRKKYALIICGEEPDLEDVEETSVMSGCEDWVTDLRRRGILLSLVGLQPGADATTVKVRENQVLLSDGPFAETKEQVGGFAVVECHDLDEAIAIAARHPAASYGEIEVRPLHGE